MADNKSCEGKLTTLECMECGYREVFTERQFKCTDGLSCDVCNGPTQPVITRPGAKINNRRMKKENEKNEVVTYATYSCLHCEHKEKVRGKRKDYSEVKVCPKCNGAFVDLWKIYKYKQIENKTYTLPKGTKVFTHDETKQLLHNNTGTDWSTDKDFSVDLVPTIKQLKAIQREAKKATAALKELEGVRTNTVIFDG